jgi:hypothetical protein
MNECAKALLKSDFQNTSVNDQYEAFVLASMCHSNMTIQLLPYNFTYGRAVKQTLAIGSTKLKSSNSSIKVTYIAIYPTSSNIIGQY